MLCGVLFDPIDPPQLRFKNPNRKCPHLAGIEVKRAHRSELDA
jgi:hypothetical protein